MKKFFKIFMYEVDHFKAPFQLLIRNKKFSSTFLGSFLSLSIFGIVLYLFFTSNMLLKVNPIVIDQTATNDHAPLLNMTKNNFEIAAGVADSFGLGYSDPTIFKIQFIQIGIEFNDSINKKEIISKLVKKTEQCTPDNFKIQSTFSDLGLANYTCLKNPNFQLEGGFDERFVKSLVVMISYCNNETDGVVCKTQGEINQFFKGKGLWLYYQDDIYDISNYPKPLKKNWRLQAIQVAAVPRIIDLYLKKLEFINDDHFLFSSESTEYGFMKERSEGLSHYVMVESPLISINLFSSKNIQKTKRQYQKLGDLLASIGGVINCLIIFGFIVTEIENKLQMQNFIMNRIYSYSYEKKEKLNKNEKNSNLKSAKSEPINNQYDWNKDYDEMINKDASNFLALNKDESQDLSIRNNPENLNQNYLENELFSQISKKNTISQIQLNLKEESKILRPDLNQKSKFLKIETNILKTFAPQHSRVNTPELRPKHMVTNLEVSTQNNQNLKDFDENSPVTLSISEYFRLIIKKFLKKPLTPKEKLFKVSQKKFKKETDICYVLEKIQEFEKMKLILLNPSQLEIFHLLSKPLIYLDNLKENSSPKRFTSYPQNLEKVASLRNDTKKRIAELKKHYQNLSGAKELTKVDKILLDMIKEDIFSQ